MAGFFIVLESKPFIWLEFNVQSSFERNRVEIHGILDEEGFFLSLVSLNLIMNNYEAQQKNTLFVNNMQNHTIFYCSQAYINFPSDKLRP